jgi:hypothetical protein
MGRKRLILVAMLVAMSLIVGGCDAASTSPAQPSDGLTAPVVAPPAQVDPEPAAVEEMPEISEEPKKTENEGPKVYITDTGEKYHRGSCSYLRQSKHAITLTEALGGGYEPCGRCGPPQ